MTKHTPGKLIVLDAYTNRNCFPIGYDRGDGSTGIIAEVNGNGGTESENRQTANRLAHCWNCHDELLEALRLLLADSIAAKKECLDPGSQAEAIRNGVSCRIQETAQSAIAKATQQINVTKE